MVRARTHQLYLEACSKLYNIMLVTTKVHLMLKSFVVVIWMYDKRELALHETFME